jgi:peptidyl-tRNA hydrolase, PTH1 family
VKLVIGLGNPGRKYARSRHNVGFLVVEHIAGQNDIGLRTKRSNALVGECSSHSEQIVLAKPQLYMNRSGESVKALIREFHARADDVVVVYDDLDLPFGRIRIRSKGSAGGHRGVASIIDSLAGAPFHRVRVGIGRPPAGMEPADYVLEAFSDQEAAELDDVVTRASEAVICLLRDGSQKAMAQFNCTT